MFVRVDSIGYVAGEDGVASEVDSTGYEVGTEGVLSGVVGTLEVSEEDVAGTDGEVTGTYEEPGPVPTCVE